MPLLAVVDRPGLKRPEQDPPPIEERKKQQKSDYYNSILLKMTPKLSKLEMIIFSILDGICKGNKKRKTCCLSIRELTAQISCRMPGGKVNPGSVKVARRKLERRGLLVKVRTWDRKKVFTTAIPRAEAEGFKGLQVPFEAMTHPNLSQAAKLIFGRFHYLLTVNDEKRIYIDWTDPKIADDLNIGLAQTKKGIALLKANGFIVIRHPKSRYRKIGLHPEWDITNRVNLSVYEPTAKKSKGDKTIAVEPMKGDKTIVVEFLEQPNFINKKVDFQGPNKYKDNKASYFLSENKYQAAGLVTKQAKPSIEQEGTKMPVSARAVGRVLIHWNSKGAPLTRHKAGGTKQFKNITAALQEALLGATEKEILEAIDLYHKSLTNPTLTLYRFRHLQPTKVSLDEFFKFRPESVNMINIYKISQLQGVKSWFELLRKGEKAIRDRFGIVPEDKHPIVTSMLKKTIAALGSNTPVTGNNAERILRQASCKLVDMHQRIKPRILGWRKVEVFSAPEFLAPRLYDYIRNGLNLECFELYWLLGERFYRDFERYLEKVGAVKPRQTEPEKRHRYGRPNDQNLPFRGRGRAVDSNGHDCQRDLSLPDF